MVSRIDFFINMKANKTGRVSLSCMERTISKEVVMKLMNPFVIVITNQQHQAKTLVDHIDQFAGRGVIPAPFFQPQIENPRRRVGRQELLGHHQQDNALVENLEH